MWLKGLVFLLIIFAAAAGVFPPPVLEEYPGGELTLSSACNLFHFPSDHPLIQSGYYFNKILKRLNRNLDCSKPLTYLKGQHISLTTAIKNDLKPESYEIIINENGIEIIHSDYSGYVYALESLSQLIKKGKVPYGYIKDDPLLQYRGIMIDSARHFLSVQSIKRLLESMPLSKLNILHWHLVDDESFPVELQSHPELAAAGKFSSKQVYSKADIKKLIDIAQQNAVQIVPEIDTPAHVRSWGQASTWSAKNISIKCNGGTGYNGQFDLSIPDVYNMTKDVVKQIDGMFASSPYIHLGGDEVSSNCWNLRPEIQNFMKQNNIASYGMLQMYWRSQIKSVLQSSRKVIFWRNDGSNVTTTGNDILHYWGAQGDVAAITANSTSQIILSPSDILYLNKGQGNLWLNASQGDYAIWLSIYQTFIVFPQGVDKNRILGAEACLWGEVSDEDTLENNLWMRASAFAAKVWSEKKLQTHELVAGLVEIQYTLYDMGVDASPITSEFCQLQPKVCFPPASEATQEKTISVIDVMDG